MSIEIKETKDFLLKAAEKQTDKEFEAHLLRAVDALDRLAKVEKALDTARKGAAILVRRMANIRYELEAADAELGSVGQGRYAK